MTTVKITRVWKGVKETKYGEKQSVAIKCEQLGDSWLSTFKVTKNMDNWKEGDQVEINITKKEVNGKTFLNFEEGLDIGNLQPKSEPVVQGKGMDEDIFEF